MSKPQLFKAVRAAARQALRLTPSVLVAMAALGCTDLTENPSDALTPANTFRTNDEILAGLTAVYANLRGIEDAPYNISEVSSDEQIVPTRGSDWFDNGKWLDLHKLTYTPNSSSGIDLINAAWNELFTGISRANLVINSIQSNSVAGQDEVVAELRVLRAFHYYWLMDLFGGVPIVTDNAIQQRPRNTRAEVFAFVEKELNESRAALPDNPIAPGRVTKSVVDAMLANLYLNAPVYTGTPTATGITPGAARWNDAIAAANRVINSGKFSLSPNYLAVFAPDNNGNGTYGTPGGPSNEAIFITRHVNQSGLGNQMSMRALHYNSVNPGAWNGWAMPADAYTKYDATDARRNAILVARRESSFVTNAPINDRSGAPLFFTTTIRDVTAASEAEGARLVKYRPAAVAPDGNHPNNFVWFRLAEMYMIRAEASLRNGDAGTALADVNRLRDRAFNNNAAKRLSSIDLPTLLNERLFEFAGEMKRRQDQIRFGVFNQAYQYKTSAPGYKALFPIPVNQLQTNPQLQQNPGY